MSGFRKQQGEFEARIDGRLAFLASAISELQAEIARLRGEIVPFRPLLKGYGWYNVVNSRGEQQLATEVKKQPARDLVERLNAGEITPDQANEIAAALPPKETRTRLGGIPYKKAVAPANGSKTAAA